VCPGSAQSLLESNGSLSSKPGKPASRLFELIKAAEGLLSSSLTASQPLFVHFHSLDPTSKYPSEAVLTPVSTGTVATLRIAIAVKLCIASQGSYECGSLLTLNCLRCGWKCVAVLSKILRDTMVNSEKSVEEHTKAKVEKPPTPEAGLTKLQAAERLAQDG